MKIRKLLEELAYIKFKYSNYKEDPIPKAKILDFKYPGISGQKTYGQRNDLLGWNLNYFNNRKYAEKAIDDITSFAKMLSANKEEMYKRIKHFYPEQAKYIRRYNRKYIKGLKQKINGLWRKKDYNDLIDYNKNAF